MCAFRFGKAIKTLHHSDGATVKTGGSVEVCALPPFARKKRRMGHRHGFPTRRMATRHKWKALPQFAIKISAAARSDGREVRGRSTNWQMDFQLHDGGRIHSMTVRWIVAILALVGMSACGIVSNLICFEMVEQVNSKVPAERRFSLLGWYGPKYVRLFAEYKRQFPNGKLSARAYAVIAVAFSCLACLTWVVAQ